LLRMKYLGTNLIPAIPTLARYVREDDYSIMPIRCIGKLGLEPEISVPALTNVMSGLTNPMTKESFKASFALDALKQFGDQARPATNFLVPLLSNTNEFIRGKVTDALQAIAPELVSTNSLPVFEKNQ